MRRFSAQAASGSVSIRRLLVRMIMKRVGPICEQKDGYEQPTPIERALAAVPRNFGRRTTIVTQFPNPEIFP